MLSVTLKSATLARRLKPSTCILSSPLASRGSIANVKYGFRSIRSSIPISRNTTPPKLNFSLRRFSSASSQPLDDTLNEVSSATNWKSYFPENGEMVNVEFAGEVEKQFAKVTANLGNRHLRYDLVTLCLRAVRPPLSDEYGKVSVLLKVCEESLNILKNAEKFKKQLTDQLTKHMTEFQRLDIKTKVAEHKDKVLKTQWSHLPLMATYAHYLLLDGQLAESHEIVSRALHLSLSHYYFSIGVASEQVPQYRDNAALMHCRALSHWPSNSAAFTNLAVLEFYHDVDTRRAAQLVEDEIWKAKTKNKGLHQPAHKPYERNEKFKRDRAVEFLSKAISSDIGKQNYLAHYHLAFILETAVGDLTKAREEYSKTLEINPDHYQSHTNLGSLLLDEKLYDKALHHYQQAKILAPNEILVYVNLANCLGYQGAIEAAVKEMQRAIRKEPIMPQLQHQLGMILVRAKHLDEALASFERALQLHAEFPGRFDFDPSATYNMMIPILKELAGRSMAEGDMVEEFEEAGKLLARCLDILPEGSTQTPLILTNLAFCFLKANRPLAAIEAINEAEKVGGETFFDSYRTLQQQDSREVVTSQLQQHYSSLEETDAMIAYLLRHKDSFVPESAPLVVDDVDSVKKKPKKRVLKNKSSVQSKIKKPSPVENDAQEVATPLSNNDESIAAMVEDIEEDMVLSNQAKAQLELLGQHKARLHYNLAFCLSYLGELDLCRSHLKQAIEIDPNCTSDYVTFAPAGEVSEDQVQDLNLEGDFVAMMKDKRSPGPVNVPVNDSSYIPATTVKSDSIQEHTTSNVVSTSSSRPGSSAVKIDDVELQQLLKEVDEDELMVDEEDTELGPDFPDDGDDIDAMDHDIDDMIQETQSSQESAELPDVHIGPASTSEGEKQSSTIPQRPSSVTKERVSASSIRRKAETRPYTKAGMHYQLESLINPPDGSKPTEATLNLVKYLGELGEKHKDADLNALDAELLAPPRVRRTIRTAKSKRRKQLKYSIDASKRYSAAGSNDDGFDSPL